MTLIVNRINIDIASGDHDILCAADEFISLKGKFHSWQTKILPIPRLNMVISFFGLAEIIDNQSRKNTISQIIEKFTKNTTATNITQAAHDFRSHMVSNIPSRYLAANTSGFHICGMENGLPMLFHFSNINGMNGYNYGSALPQYGSISEDFLRRDAITNFQFNGTTFGSSGGFEYRNGDIAMFNDFSHSLIQQIVQLANHGRSVRINSKSQRAKMLQFIYKTIIGIQNGFMNSQIVGGKPTIYLIDKYGVQQHSRGSFKRIK